MIDFEKIIKKKNINEQDLDNLQNLTDEEITKIIQDYDFSDEEFDKLQKILKLFESEYLQYSEDSDFNRNYLQAIILVQCYTLTWILSHFS